MVSDYLFCGTCFVNFRLCDINLFIEHKKNNCDNSGSGPKSSPDPVNSSTDAFVANLLECVQCFRRFSTAWPLLMHVQFEHQMLFANAFKNQQKALQDPMSTIVSDEISGNENPPGPVQWSRSSSGDQADVGSSSFTPSNQVTSVETQTVLSSFKAPVRARRKRTYPSCCTSFPNSSGLPDTTHGFVCDAVSVSRPCTNSETCCPTDTAVCDCRCLCISSTQSAACPACLPSSRSTVDCSSCKQIKPIPETGVFGKTPPCCLPLNCSTKSPANLSPDCSQRAVGPCCPCPPPSAKPSVTSAEAQTDFEPDFLGPNYEDIAMLLASPSKSYTTSPIPSNMSAPEQTPPSMNLSAIPDPIRTPNPTFEGNLVSMFPVPDITTDSSQPLVSALSSVRMTSYQPIDSSLNVNLPLSSPTMPVTILNCDASTIGSSSFVQASVPTKVDLPSSLVSERHIEVTGPQFTCDQCGRIYRQKIHLRKHILIQHVGKKPFECPLCNYTTVEKSHLTVHIRTHTGERPFQCRECEYSSSQNCTLKSHYMRKHSDSYLYCNKCSEKYFTEQELQKHERQCFFEKQRMS